MEIGLLGPLEVSDDAGGPVVLAGGKLGALLAVLALRAGQVVSAERLVEDLWGPDAKASAANSLQGLVSKLRRALPAGVVVTRPPGYVLAVAPEAVDVGRFERLVIKGREAAAGGDAPGAAALLGEALGLWRGPALAEFAYDEFAQSEVVRLGEARLATFEDRIEADLGCGRHAELVGELQALVSDHPLRERLRGQLMVALYRSGRQADALRCYQDGRTTLVDELGIDPGPALQHLEAAVLAHDPALAPPAVTRGDDVPDDADRPAPSAGRPLPWAAVAGSLTSFVGRTNELVEVTKLVGEARLVTITGPGGAGKTRLAVEVGTQLQTSVPDGVWLVELAPLSDPSSLPRAVAAVLGVREHTPLVPAPGAGPEGSPRDGERLVEYLDGKNVLLVLDNCEHLVEAAAGLVRRLLAHCSQLRVLATSREPLAVPGEVQWPIPPLGSPAVGASQAEVAASEAVRLFTQRAAAVQPSFILTPKTALEVADICRRLDGIPLAIELAAARVKVLPVAQIAERLDDRFHLLTGGMRTALPRHRTLAALVDWSYDLLTESERIGFEALSVFVGGCPLDAAERVCAGAGIDPGEVIDVVAHLVDKSLLVAGQGADGTARYRMLETLRQYGLDKLAAGGRVDAARQRHLEWCLALAEQAEPQMRGPNQRHWLDRLEADHDNLRGALEWAIRRDNTEPALRLGAALAWFWWVRGHQREGRAWLEDALATVGPVDRATRATALSWAGYLATDHDLDRAISWGEDAVSASVGLDEHVRARAQMRLATSLVRAGDHERIALLVAEAIPPLQRSGDDWWIGWAHNVASFDALFRGDLAAAETACRQSFERFGATGSSWGKGRTLHKLAIISELRGDDEGASALYYESLAFARSLGLDEVVAVMLIQLAALVARRGDLAGAEDLRAESRGLVRALGRIDSDHSDRTGTGVIARRRSDLARAAGLFEEALAWYRQAGVPSGAALSLSSLGFLAEMRDDHAEATRRYRDALEAAADATDTATMASALDGLARVAIASGQEAWGATILGGAAALRRTFGLSPPRSEEIDTEQATGAARTSLSGPGFAAAWERGESMPASHVINLARAGRDGRVP